MRCSRRSSPSLLPPGLELDFHTFVLYVLTEGALSLAPGPAVMLVVATGLTQGAPRAGLATAGILSANLLYFLVSATGLSSLLAGSVGLFQAVRYLGALYLLWLGATAILGKPGVLSPLAAASAGPLRTYRAGLLLQLGNPKSLLCFLAILPQFIDPRAPLGTQMIWLAAGSMLPELAILVGYGHLAARARRLYATERFARWTERLAGGLLIGTAALVAGAGR